jgi:Fe-S-cluster containining protein
MARFECTRCGKCCQSFGEFIRVERKLTERDYYCRYGITNELFLVHVQPEFADRIPDEFSERDGTKKDPAQKGCIFVQKNPEGKGFACAIYPTRPPVCREFRCYRMLIYHTLSGELRGKVIGINDLRTDDGILAGIWKEKIAPLPHPVESRHIPGQTAHSPGAPAVHGQDTHIHAHLYGLTHNEDKVWVNNVITELAAHGYHGDPVEE